LTTLWLLVGVGVLLIEMVLVELVDLEQELG
jgi:hypothetical protein